MDVEVAVVATNDEKAGVWSAPVTQRDQPRHSLSTSSTTISDELYLFLCFLDRSQAVSPRLFAFSSRLVAQLPDAAAFLAL